MRIRKRLWIVVGIIACFLLISITYIHFFAMEKEVPQEVKELVEHTLRDLQIDRANVISNIHFEPAYADEADMLLEVTEKVLDYQLKNIDKINENLYAITFIAKTQYSNGEYKEYYNFVGNLNNQYCYILSKRNIPDAIKGGLTEEKYSYHTVEAGGENLYS